MIGGACLFQNMISRALVASIWSFSLVLCVFFILFFCTLLRNYRIKHGLSQHYDNSISKPPNYEDICDKPPPYEAVINVTCL